MKYNIVKTSKVVKTPAYVKEIYGKVYENEKISRLLDDERIVSLITCFQQYKLIDDVTKEIATNSSVLQMGCTFGRQIEATAEKVGAYGHYVIADVLPLQIERCKSKTVYQKINFLSQDVSKAFSEKFDTVICYMLLHELPPATKAKVINNALNSVEEGGKVIFIDYHKPAKWNLLRFLIKPFNRLYQPFAESMWEKSIDSYAKDKECFSWRKKTYFGKMYQKVVAVRQLPNYEKPPVKQSFY
ncbi:MAG: rhodoquinone biosynthesis methyltransferase RquA [Alphaproteobacteria bacterium]|nr:rhodoquinone biosynthesis methyltransferase RquA [Alphaproteobacteria bacterium]